MGRGWVRRDLFSSDPMHSRATAIYNTNHYMKRQLDLTNFVYLQSKGSACGGLGWGEVLVGFGGCGGGDLFSTQTNRNVGQS